MAKVSKSILFAYNKCADLATKWQNILDSYRHKDEKITKEDLDADVLVEVVDNLESTEASKALSAKQGKNLKDQQDVNFENIATNEEAIGENSVSIAGLEYNKSNKENTINLSAEQEIGVLKTFLYDKLGLRNFANTFTSFFRNSNTGTRYYTLQDRNGVIADDTDLAGKQDKLEGQKNFIPKSIDENTMVSSRLEDTGTSFGIGTSYPPSKDLTLKNGFPRVIGIEESDANTKGQNLTIQAGITNDYRVSNEFSLFKTANISIIDFAISEATGDVFAFSTDDKIYKQTGGEGLFNLHHDFGIGATYNASIYLDNNTNDLYCGNYQSFFKQTNCQGSFDEIGNTSFRAVCVGSDGTIYLVPYSNNSKEVLISDTNGENFVSTGQFSDGLIMGIDISVNGDLYVVTRNYAGIPSRVYKRSAVEPNFIDLQQDTSYSYKDVVCSPNGNVYISTTTKILEQTQGEGDFVPTLDVERNYRGLATANGNVYVVENSNIYELSFLAKGTSNLDGGTLKHKAGTGKGSGKSRQEFYTGQKLESGTEMQTETLRMTLDEDGVLNYEEDVSEKFTDSSVPNIGHVKKLIGVKVKKYVALLTQTGTEEPIAIVLENTLGEDVVWTRNGEGDYWGSASNSVFTTNKTTVLNSNPDSGSDIITKTSVSTERRVIVRTMDPIDSIRRDGKLYNTTIEIKVYEDNNNPQ